ncbi:MAG: hypothetical protein QM778_05020 [Myxococcales bacterium]
MANSEQPTNRDLETLTTRLAHLERRERRRRKRAWTLAGIAALLCAGLWADRALSEPNAPNANRGHGWLYYFNAGSPAVAIHVNSNFEELANRIDGLSAALADTNNAVSSLGGSLAGIGARTGTLESSVGGLWGRLNGGLKIGEPVRTNGLHVADQIRLKLTGDKSSFCALVYARNLSQPDSRCYVSLEDDGWYVYSNWYADCEARCVWGP